MNPMLAVKWLAGLGLALLLFFGGRSCGVNAGHKQLAACRADHVAAVDAGRSMAAALDTATNLAEQAELAEAEQTKRAEVAIRQAGEARTKYAADLQAIETSLAAGMKNPTCRARLEEATCVPLL